jgi:predicted amino acid racemase
MQNLIEEYSLVTKEINELKMKLRDLKKKSMELESEIIETMQKENTEQLGNVVLYKKKVFKAELDKKTVRDKIASQLHDPVKTDNLTEQLFRKEVTYKDTIKVVK